MRKQIWISILSLILLMISSGRIEAQGTVTQWLRYDVTLTIQQNSGLLVEEVHEVALAQGTTTFQRVIPADKLESISHIEVLALSGLGEQRSYQQADTQTDYTFQVTSSGGQYTIQLYFPPTSVSNAKFVLRYFVTGSLGIYDEGDRLDWRPFGEAAPGPIGVSNITVNLPTAVAREQLLQSSTGVATEKSVADDKRVVFRTANVAAGDELEVSLTFPHGIVQGSPPGWQQIADFIPALRWTSVIVALLLLIGGVSAAFGMWYMRTRQLFGSGGKVPKYIKSPPSDLSPAVAGALLDGKFKPRHLTATLLDLAFRGAMNIYAKNANGSLPNNKVEAAFNLYGVEQERAGKPYEATLYGKIFGFVGGSNKRRELSAVRRDLYMAVPELKNQIDLEISKAGYFSTDSKTTRRQYMFVGGASIIVTLILTLIVALLSAQYTAAMALPCLSLAVGAAAFTIVGYALPNETTEGAKEVAHWKAFRRYLQELDKNRVKKSRPRFAQLLPYAVSFGLENDFIKKFAVMNAPIPAWWSIPEEKLPDVSHEKAHAWVSESAMSQPGPRPQKTRTTTAIRRLGTPKEETEPVNSLKGIHATFVAFIKAGHEVFSVAPDIHDEEIDFDSLAD